MTHWIVREWMNAISLGLCLCLTYRFAKVALTTPRHLPRHQAAVALLVFCLGESIRSAWAWLALASQNKGWAIFPAVQSSYWAGILAIVVIVTGALCCIRVFSPPDERGGWLAAILLSGAFLLTTILL